MKASRLHVLNVCVATLLVVTAIAALSPGSARAAGAGSVSLTTLGVAVSQNFDSLATTGTANIALPAGWYLSESGTSSRNNDAYAASTGSDNAGDVYSFGAAGNVERAYGTLRSGTLAPIIGASFTNSTGAVLTALDIAYTGEQWRAGVTNRNAADRLDFQISTDATSLTTGTWTDVDGLDLNSPNIAAATNTLDGNAASNRAAISFTVAGLSIPSGSSFWIRWTDFDISSSDDGLAIDDFSLTPQSVAADAAPSVTGTTPADGATSVPVVSNITVNFSEAVDVAAGAITVECPAGNAVASNSAADNVTSVVIDPAADLPLLTTCVINVSAAGVTDEDANDPPDSMAADFTAAFTTEGPVCAQPFTPIYAIQGSGLSAAITGTVTTQGVVVGDFGGPTTTGLQGFYLQDLNGDGNAATSDGIFVYTGDNDPVSAGQVVRVTGFARERFNQTALNGSNSNSAPVTNIINCGDTGAVAPVDVLMPFPDSTYLERFEGMLVRLPQALVIAEYFNYERFGEMVLALPLDGETRPFTGTAIDEPGAAANARTLANSLRRITLDDGLGVQNPAFVRHPNGGNFGLDNLFRGGDTVQNTVGVLGFDFSLYRIQPTGPADYVAVNPRPAAPEPVGGRLRVAAMNTLNYFLTPDNIQEASNAPDNPADNLCGPIPSLECRGWDGDQPLELARQRDKLLAALAGLDADIIGLNELENTTGVEPLADIVAGLPGYAYINTGVIGGDAIKVGLIYRPGKVVPIGDFALLTSAVDPRFVDTLNRPALAQTFEEIASGARFTVVVNHLKSKGSACAGDPDIGDGQGNCNQTRTAAAQALVDWLATDPTGSGDPDFLIMGDLNSYAQEDPIDAIKAGPDDTPGTGDDYTNLIALYQGAYAYSYVFDGQAGYLDHALASPSLLAQVTGAADWHINADEPDFLDYDTSFKPPTQEAVYEPNAYRSSDHDPLVVGLNLVDVIPPDTLITAAPGVPATPLPLSDDRNPVFEFTGTDNLTAPANLTFECRLDGGGWTACASPTQYLDLAYAVHTFEVRAIDEAGNVDPTPAVYTWDLRPSCEGVFATRWGTDGPDTLDGTDSGDVIVGLGGNDTINGLGGNDLICGDGGRDTLDGGLGNDRVFGGAGNDTITGGAGNDILNGGAGDDQMTDTVGANVFNGDAGNDTITGGNGLDALNGGAGNDVLNGGGGQDTLNGEAGDDQLYGGAGPDILTGGAGADFFSGGPGADIRNDFEPAQGDTTDGT